MDGLKVKTKAPEETDLQNRDYNGWTGDVNQNLLLVWDPRGKIVDCTINAPGNFHDGKSARWGRIYNHILQIPQGFLTVCDSAFSTEEEFKLALIQMELPDARERAYMEENLSKENMARAISLQGMSAAQNYRYAMSQQLQNIQNSNRISTNPLLSPVAWLSFINSVKSGSLLQKSDNKEIYIPKNQGSRDALFKTD